MNCPVCNIPLTMSERQGVEIDFCSKCRGVWLDRGELDKIIERVSSEITPPPRQERPEDRPERQDDRHERHYDKNRDRYYGQYYKKKKSFLSDIFD